MLRPGSKGEAVRRLQERLRSLGFDPGPVDGVYGCLTMGAVRDFQRACGLGPDGVAGRRTVDALFDQDLDLHRGLELVAEPAADAGRAAARAVERQRKVLAAVARPWPVGDDQAPAPSGAPDTARWIVLHNRRAGVPGHCQREGPASLQALLHTRAGRRLLEQRLEAAAAADADVLHLDLGTPRWGDGAQFLRAVRRGARLAAAAGRRLAVSLPLRDLDRPWSRLTNDLDYAAVGRLAHRIVLTPPAFIRAGGRLRPPAPRELGPWVRAAVRRLPPWRCLLAVGVAAVALSGDSARFLPYAQAMAAAYRARVRPEGDEAAGRPVFSARLDQGDAVVWLETAASLAARISIIRRYRLAGAYLAGVGAEDQRLWRVLREGSAARGTASG